MEGDGICIILTSLHHCLFIPIKLNLPSPSYYDNLLSFLPFTRFVTPTVTKKISMKKNYSHPLPWRKRQRKNDWNASLPVTNIPPSFSSLLTFFLLYDPILAPLPVFFFFLHNDAGLTLISFDPSTYHYQPTSPPLFQPLYLTTSLTTTQRTSLTTSLFPQGVTPTT